MPSGGHHSPTAFIFLVNSHSKKSLFLLTMGLAGRIQYWDSGLTIQEYSELKELPYESTRRWIRVLQKARQDDASTPESLELVEIKPLQTNASDSSGIRLLIDGIEIAVAKGFDGTTLSEVLNLLKARSCSASAVR